MPYRIVKLDSKTNRKQTIFFDIANKLKVADAARCRFFLQGVKDLRSSNECSEEFIYIPVTDQVTCFYLKKLCQTFYL
jgi:hypothetical protein